MSEEEEGSVGRKHRRHDASSSSEEEVVEKQPETIHRDKDGFKVSIEEKLMTDKSRLQEANKEALA